MNFLGSSKACFVNIKSLFAGDVTADFEGQAVGGVEVEGDVSVEGGFVLGANVIEVIL